MLRYSLIFNMNFCYDKKFLDRKSFCINEAMRKIFLSRNLSLNMPKNVLISLKNCKNRHCELFSLHMPTKAQNLSDSKKYYFLVIVAGVHQALGIVKIMLHFACHTTKIITIGFKFFSFVPPLILRWRRPWV